MPPFLDSLTAHIALLQNRMAHFEKLKDDDRCVSYRYSSIICLTTLAEAYNQLAKSTYTSAFSFIAYRVKCSEALNGVVELTRSQRDDDFSFLDPLLGVSSIRPILRLRFTPF